MPCNIINSARKSKSNIINSKSQVDAGARLQRAPEEIPNTKHTR
jgi:hypothetical protein